jgi:hypothetical protein
MGSLYISDSYIGNYDTNLIAKQKGNPHWCRRWLGYPIGQHR